MYIHSLESFAHDAANKAWDLLPYGLLVQQALVLLGRGRGTQKRNKIEKNGFKPAAEPWKKAEKGNLYTSDVVDAFDRQAPLSCSLLLLSSPYFCSSAHHLPIRSKCCFEKNQLRVGRHQHE